MGIHLFAPPDVKIDATQRCKDAEAPEKMQERLMHLAALCNFPRSRLHQDFASARKRGVGKALKTLLLVLCVLLAAVGWRPSRASASPPPENWGCRTVYPIRIQRDSIFWNYWEYAGAMASGRIRFWKHYYVVYNHPNWVMQYVHTDSVFCP